MLRGRLWDRSKSDPISNPPSERTTLLQFWPILKIYDVRKRLGWLLAALLWSSTLQNGPQYHTFALFLKIYDFRTPPAAAPPPVAPPPLRRRSAAAPPPLPPFRMDNSITVLAAAAPPPLRRRFAAAPPPLRRRYHPSERTTVSQFWLILKIYDLSLLQSNN